MFGFYVNKRCEIRLQQHFCTLLKLSLLPENDYIFIQLLRANNIIHKII